MLIRAWLQQSCLKHSHLIGQWAWVNSALAWAMFLSAHFSLRADEPSFRTSVTEGFVSAQSAARLRVAIPSLTQVEMQLQWLIELSPTPDLRKQWKKLKQDYIEAYTDGVDESRPIAIDILFEKDRPYIIQVPISNFSGEKNSFLAGLRGRGYKVKTTAEHSYELLDKGSKPISLVYEQNYALIAMPKRSPSISSAMGGSDMSPRLAFQSDIVAELKNNAEGRPLRRTNFQDYRAEVAARSKIRKNEDPNAFARRKVLQKQLLNEAQRLIVEAERLRFEWTMNPTRPVQAGIGRFSLTALPGTDLFKNLDQVAAKPSRFATAHFTDHPSCAVRWRVPLDSTRSGQLIEVSKSLRPIFEAEINGLSSRRTDSQKKASIRAIGVLGEIMEAAAALDSVDGFAEYGSVVANKNILVCGIRIADGKRADELINLIPQMNADWQVKQSDQVHGDVSIHELTIAKPYLTAFQILFEGETTIYLGTSPNAVWAAAGFDALTHLNRAIDQVAKPAFAKDDPVAFSLHADVHNVFRVLEAIGKELPSVDTLTFQQKRVRKEHEKQIKLALDASSACDPSIGIEVRRTDTGIEGHCVMSECFLKCVGSIFANAISELN